MFLSILSKMFYKKVKIKIQDSANGQIIRKKNQKLLFYTLELNGLQIHECCNVECLNDAMFSK